MVLSVQFSVAILSLLTPIWALSAQDPEQVGSTLNIWADHKEWIIIALVVLLAQATAIAGLMISRHRRLTRDLVAAKADAQHQMQIAEDHLQSKILIQRVIDASPDWIFVKDEQNRFLIVNEPFARAFKQSPENLVGHVDTDFIPRELCEGNPQVGSKGLHDYDKAVFCGETVHLFPEKISLEGDRPRVFDTFKIPLRDAHQRIFGNLCYRRDITERFIRELDQQTLELQLQQAQKMELIGHLTGGVAHDFNNILASILGYAELLQMTCEADLKPSGKKYVREILQAGIRGKKLIQQLLTFSQKREAVAMTIFVQPIVKEVVKLLQSTLPASISVQVHISKDLPQVLISPVQLHQVLMNLAVNARDAISGQGSIEIDVESLDVVPETQCASCHSSFGGSYVVISVRDNGCGVTEENRTKIFDPFFTTKPVGFGSGLGLSVLHGIVHSVDGHIRLLSQESMGSEFKVYLPAQLQTRQSPSPRHLNGQTPGTRIAANVLVVDDEAPLVGMLKDLLENAGCNVIGLTNAVEALRLFQAAPDSFDLIITDFTMPGINGLELSREILQAHPGIPIIMCTGYSALIDEHAALEVGIRRFLLKPVPSTSLLEAVVACLPHKERSDLEGAHRLEE